MNDDAIARDRNGMEVLDYDVCLRLLEAQVVGPVVVTGAAEPVDAPDVSERLEQRGLDAWALTDADDRSWVRLRTDTVTGRRIGSRAPPADRPSGPAS